MAAGPEGELTDLKVLIVEDSPSYALVLRRLLEKNIGVSEVAIVNNVRDAKEALMRHPSEFNVLFIDYHFPTGDTGAQLLRELRASNLLQGKVPFIITSDPTIDTAEKALNAGAAGVIAKPLRSDQLRKQMLQARRILFPD